MNFFSEIVFYGSFSWILTVNFFSKLSQWFSSLLPPLVNCLTRFFSVTLVCELPQWALSLCDLPRCALSVNYFHELSQLVLCINSLSELCQRVLSVSSLCDVSQQNLRWVSSVSSLGVAFLMSCLYELSLCMSLLSIPLMESLVTSSQPWPGL